MSLPVKVAKKPNNQAQVNQQAKSVVAMQQWSGPLPHPSALAQFDQVVPGVAERIVSMVEQEQAHRFAHDTQALTAETKDTRRRNWLGALISLASIAASVFTAYIDAHWSVSVALVGLPVAAMIGSVAKK